MHWKAEQRREHKRVSACNHSFTPPDARNSQPGDWSSSRFPTWVTETPDLSHHLLVSKYVLAKTWVRSGTGTWTQALHYGMWALLQCLEHCAALSSPILISLPGNSCNLQVLGVLTEQSCFWWHHIPLFSILLVTMEWNSLNWWSSHVPHFSAWFWWERLALTCE